MMRPLHSDDALELWPTHPRHAIAMHELIVAQTEHLGVFLPWPRYMQTVAACEAYLQKSMQAMHDGQEYSYLMYTGGLLVGRIGLHYVHRQNRCAALGYWISAEYEGRGMMSAAARALVQKGFGEFQLHRIELKAAVQNFRSAAVARRLGFVEEGLLRDAEWLGDRFTDLLLFAALQTEWMPPEAPGWAVRIMG